MGLKLAAGLACRERGRVRTKVSDAEVASRKGEEAGVLVPRARDLFSSIFHVLYLGS